MKVKIYTDSLDYLNTNLLVIPFFKDAKPLKGTMGFVDWRLNGFLSRLFMDEKISDRDFEKILIPPFERIPAERVLLVSLGEAARFDAHRMTDLSFKILETVHKIDFSNFVISLPQEIEAKGSVRDLIDNLFKGIDRFAVKIGPCDFLENLKITFVLNRERQPKLFQNLSEYLSARSASSHSLVNV